jgi:timeless
MTSGFGVGITSATPNQQTKMTTTAGVPTTATTTQQSSSRRENNNRKKKKHIVTPTAKTSLDHRMSVDKNIIDELLLVCGVIGTTTNAGNDLVPVTDCLNWLQDLQRALRRDEDLYRPISLLIGKWKVVEQKLIPLVMTCRYDTPIVLTVVKILVILTKPLADNTKRAGQMIIDTMSNKSDPDVVAQQIKLRDNALAQAEQLMEYKRHVTFHSSHRQGASDQNRRISSTGGGTGLFSIIVSLLAEPLSKSGASRTDADHLTIELVLHLIRNLLATEPLLNSTYSVLGNAEYCC